MAVKVGILSAGMGIIAPLMNIYTVSEEETNTKRHTCQAVVQICLYILMLSE